MTAKFALSAKEPAWAWEESPTQYYSTLEEAKRDYEKIIQQDGRFRCIRLERIEAPGIWTLIEEIDLGPEKNPN